MDNREIFIFGFRGFPGVQGGIETHVENLAPKLVELGHRVTACMRSPYATVAHYQQWNGVRLLRVWTARNTYLEAILHSLLCALVAGIRRPGIVHIHGIGPALVTPLLRLFGLRVIVTHHGEDYNREKWGWMARAMLRLGEYCGMRFSHQRIAISQNIAKLIAEKHGMSCEIIPNGVKFQELPSQVDKITELGLVPGKYVVTVGRIVPEKRQHDLLQAFSVTCLPDWKLVIVGQVDHKNKYADFLAGEAAGLDDVVMAGFQSGEALRQLYAHAGLFVLPSSHEGLPIALLEALSYGLPVLVSDISPNLEVVNDPARIFRMGDIGDLSEKISTLTAMKPTFAQREAVRRECGRRYDWVEIAERTSAAYAGMISKELSLPSRARLPAHPDIIPLASMPAEPVGGLGSVRRRSASIVSRPE